MSGRKWTNAQKADLAALWRANYEVTDIADILGVKKHQVAYMRKRMELAPRRDKTPKVAIRTFVTPDLLKSAEKRAAGLKRTLSGHVRQLLINDVMNGIR